jgi:uncharacterized Zn-finger protein
MVSEIKCPFCGKKFKPDKAQKSSTTEGNIVRGALFLPWGIVSALKKGIICPHCKMKIKQ